MTKSELIDKVAEKSGLTKKDAGKAVDALVDSVTESLSGGEKVQLVGFGTFEVHKREARKGRNPQSGAVINIAARKAAVFTPGQSLKDAVNK
jgi:DNA-binding protein HU-beta